MSWSPVMPTLRCRDARAEATHLTEVFGFTEHLVVPGDDGQIVHAELSFGSGMVMLGSTTDGSDGRRVFDTGPSWLYVIVEDVPAHFARAVAAGAEIVDKPVDNDFGGSSYLARDPEGNLWTFSTYVPEPAGPQP